MFSTWWSAQEPVTLQRRDVDDVDAFWRDLFAIRYKMLGTRNVTSMNLMDSPNTTMCRYRRPENDLHQTQLQNVMVALYESQRFLDIQKRVSASGYGRDCWDDGNWWDERQSVVTAASANRDVGVVDVLLWMLGY
jgi:hypothetical protein